MNSFPSLFVGLTWTALNVACDAFVDPLVLVSLTVVGVDDVDIDEDVAQVPLELVALAALLYSIQEEIMLLQ